ncbi:glucose dehydrogenase [Cryobacterium roopkundense]|uniref:Glucose dehydrogenase n=1 Tax=Cryobacterium roopkundense TaxID=1001240 RepID=A0A099JX65_9MICO|nr:PQQ-dependent sugar dehydrogenase [Cryobacterium roopkundense]KGJ82322.1 glucose dehydrogenase [Cryobacterium roopkundense]MBB5639480.1 glucose/arabinose dehydrogenase [Cryobacterium roopkundense]
MGSTVRRNRAATALGLAAVLALSACTSAPPAATPQTTTPGTGASPAVAGPVQPAGDPVVIASELDAPWSILRLPGAGTLISERDTTLVRELLADGSLREAGAVPAARPGGEGGLLGLAYLADTAASGGSGWVYAYFTTESDNRIERMPLLGAAGSHALGDPEPVLAGLPRAGNHDGGRLGFGPDGFLYATAGDAGNTSNAQDLDSLGGKILRMTPTGGVPSDNPFGTLVYSFGHRNPQGIAWDSQGRLWASEFGQNTWDELNLIEAGGNYGWPEVEGQEGNADYIDPVQQWSTDVASPSGIAIVNDTLFMANLRGARLWSVDVSEGASSTGAPTEWFVNDFGRLRDVVSGPGGTLWFVSNNTDGRGSPVAGDDRLYQVDLQEGEATDG